MLWAAAWLYMATGNNNYLSYVVTNQGWSQAASEFSWDNKFVGAQTLLAKVFANTILSRKIASRYCFFETYMVVRGFSSPIDVGPQNLPLLGSAFLFGTRSFPLGPNFLANTPLCVHSLQGLVSPLTHCLVSIPFKV